MLFGIARECRNEYPVQGIEFRCEEFELDEVLKKRFKWYSITFSTCWHVMRGENKYDVDCAFKCYGDILKSMSIENLIEPYTKFSEVVAVVLVPFTLPWYSRYNLVLPYAVWYRKPVNPFIATSNAFVNLVRWLLRGYSLLLDDVVFLALPRDSSVLEKVMKALDVPFLEVSELSGGVLIRHRDLDEYLDQLSKLLAAKEE